MEGPALDHLVCGEGRDAISLQVKGRGASSRAFDPAQDGCEPANPRSLPAWLWQGRPAAGTAMLAWKLKLSAHHNKSRAGIAGG
jgi:hypothetical protein